MNLNRNFASARHAQKSGGRRERGRNNNNKTGIIFMYFNFTFTLFTVEQGKGCPELGNNRLEENRRVVQ